MKEQFLPNLLTKIGKDDFQTPPEALNPLIPYLNHRRVIWECAAGKGNLVNALRQDGFTVIATDILEGTDFLTNNIPIAGYIITNPPFSKKNEFIERCYELGKPFALLLPLRALETKRRQAQGKKGLQLIVLNKRLHFEQPGGGKSACWFPSAWFTNGLNLPKDIVFGEV